MRRILNNSVGGIEYRQSMVKVLPNKSAKSPTFGGFTNFRALTFSMDDIWHRLPGVRYRRLTRPIIVKSQAFAAGDSENWHSHDQPQFVYTTHGVLRILTPGGAWTLAPCRGLWIPSRVGHELQAISQGTLYSVYFEGDVAPWRDTQSRVLMVSPLLRELVGAMAADLRNGHPDRRAEFIGPLLLQEMNDAHQAFDGCLPLPHDRRLQQICAALMAQPANNDSLEDWGVRIGASGRTLIRLFKHETGLTFGQWRQQMRLVESVSRLVKKMPVSAIASELGYRNAGAFITMFRKAMGETPQRYLRSLNGNAD
jgi:AraC-like DNA-binding protein